MQRVISFVLLSFMLAGALSPLFAHDEYRIVGTITKMERSQLQVKNKDGKTFSVKLDSETLIYRDKDKVGVAELKPGRTVVVDALGDSEADLLAVEVRIVPAISR